MSDLIIAPTKTFSRRLEESQKNVSNDFVILNDKPKKISGQIAKFRHAHDMTNIHQFIKKQREHNLEQYYETEVYKDTNCSYPDMVLNNAKFIEQDK
jgi:hypothetical protein